MNSGAVPKINNASTVNQPSTVSPNPFALPMVPIEQTNQTQSEVYVRTGASQNKTKDAPTEQDPSAKTRVTRVHCWALPGSTAQIL